MFYEQEYSNGIGAQIAEKVLLVMESVLQEASSSQQVIIRQDSQQTIIPNEQQSELGMLLGHMQSPFVVIIYYTTTKVLKAKLVFFSLKNFYL